MRVDKRGLALGLLVLLAGSLAGCDPDPVPEPDAGQAQVDAGGDAPACDPVCSEGEVCDSTQTPPSCFPACNPPQGCRAGLEICNAATGKCEAATCNGARCGSGESCTNLRTGTDLAPVTCSCLPRRPDPLREGRTLPDTCAALRMVCDRQSAEALLLGAGKCVKPGVKQPCASAVGCSDGLACVAVGTGSFCARACQSTSDCADPGDICREDLGGRCWSNPCAVGDRSRYFQVCDAVGFDDGTCVPRGEGNNDEGVCVLAGTAPSGGACDPEAARSSPGKRCPLNEWCVSVRPDPGVVGRRQGICRPLCNAAPLISAVPVVRCGDDGACANLFDNDAEREARAGVCQPRCALSGGEPDCPVDVLGNERGCYPLDGRDAATGVCLPIRPGAGEASGRACAAASQVEERQRCGSRLTCFTGEGAAQDRCFGFCDVTRCSDPQASCAACEAGTPRCERLLPGMASSAGVCLP